MKFSPKDQIFDARAYAKKYLYNTPYECVEGALVYYVNGLLASTLSSADPEYFVEAYTHALKHKRKHNASTPL